MQKWWHTLDRLAELMGGGVDWDLVLLSETPCKLADGHVFFSQSKHTSAAGVACGCACIGTIQSKRKASMRNQSV